MVRRRPAALHVSVWLHERRSRWRDFRSAVSLHAHTSYSREQLADLPRYLVQIPFVGSRVERELRTQCAVDFSKGWWHPPVTAREVFDAETAQIADRLNLSPLVSLTDHDDLRAGLDVQQAHARGAPRSRSNGRCRTAPATSTSASTTFPRRRRGVVRAARSLHRRARTGAAARSCSPSCTPAATSSSSSTIRAGISPTSAARPTPRCSTTSSARTANTCTRWS